MEAIVLNAVSKRYGACEVLSDLHLTFRAGEIACVLGASGAGKTTLLQVLAGLTSYEGTVTGRPERISYVFQAARLIPNLTVAQNLSLVLPEGRREEIRRVLEAVGLGDRADSYPATLSGGQAQRVSFARAFLCPSELILMDEPFSSLDTPLKLRLVALFASLWERERRTTVFVTHDAEEAAMLAERVILLADRRVKAEFACADPIPRRYGAPSPMRDRILQCME